MQDDNEAEKPIASTERMALSSERGRLLYGGDRVYLGSLDDSVSRHPWEGYRPSLRYLNRRLVDSVLFGAPIGVRIGNLLFQDQYLPALLEPHRSPLVELAKVGFVQLQMNSDTINDSIAARVGSKTQSAISMKEKHFWYHGSPSFEALASLDKALVPGVGKLRYSPSFNSYFRAIMQESAASGTPAFQQVHAQWIERPETGPDGRTRNHFEQDARHILGDERKIREAMWVANAANHYAYSLQFVGNGSGAPMVETTQFDRHAEVCATRHALPTEHAEELLAKANLSDPLNFALSVISVPPGAYDPANAAILANLARGAPPPVDAPFDENVWRRFTLAKAGLTLAICNYLENPQEQEIRPVQDHALAFNDALGLAFGRPNDRSIGMYCRILARRTVQEGPEALAQQAAGAAAGYALGNIPGFVIGVALPILGVRLVRAFDSLVRLGRSPDNPVDVGDEGEDRARTGERLARSAFLRYGSYVGVRTLNPEKAMRFRTMLTAD
jgi:hypothetical protein